VLRIPYDRRVTSREQLLELVREMPEEQADELLTLATELAETPPSRPRPDWLGAARLAPDLSERHEELLRAEFGKSA
jgi:hypothetical protein